jgi:hypothetical protein
MGWRLVREVLDRCPDIKYREFRVLIALALDARDETRQGMPGQQLLTLQANCGMRATKYAMASLAQRGLVKTVRHSAPGRRTVYEIPPIAGTGATMPAPVTSATMPAPETRVTGAKTRVTGADTEPTGADIVAPSQSLVLSHLPQSGPSAPSAQTILADFIDWVRSNGGDLTRRTIGILASQISQLIADGISENNIKRGLADWHSRAQHPSTLHSFVDAAMNGQQPKSRRQAETDAMFDRALARIEARERGSDPARGELE